MQLIELRLDGKLLHYKKGSRQDFEVVADNDDYCFKFYFDAPRQNAVAAIMELYGNPYTVLLDGNDMAAIPRGVLIGGEKLKVGLSWGEDLDAGLFTSSDLDIAVRYSIRSRLRNTEPLTPAQADIIAQFSALVNRIKSVDSVSIDSNGHLILTLTNGTTQDAGAANDWNTLQNRPFGDVEIPYDPIELPETLPSPYVNYGAKINGKRVDVTFYKVSTPLTPDELDGATLFYSINGVEKTQVIDKTKLRGVYIGSNRTITDELDSVWEPDSTDNHPGYRLVMVVGANDYYNIRMLADLEGNAINTRSQALCFASYSSNGEVVRVTKLQRAPRVITIQIPDRYIPSTAKVETAQAAAQTAQAAAATASSDKTAAQTARTQAQTAQAAAEAAQAAAEAARDESGKSAYQLAVEDGYTGTLQEWLASLVGPKGDSYELTQEDKDEIAALSGGLPPVTAADDGKIAQVKGGKWNVQHPELGEESIHFLTNLEIEALLRD